MNLGLYQPLLVCVYVYCFLRLYVYILELLCFLIDKNGTSAFYEHASESSPVIMFLYLYEIISHFVEQLHRIIALRPLLSFGRMAIQTSNPEDKGEELLIFYLQ